MRWYFLRGRKECIDIFSGVPKKCTDIFSGIKKKFERMHWIFLRSPKECTDIFSGVPRNALGPKGMHWYFLRGPKACTDIFSGVPWQGTPEKISVHARKVWDLIKPYLLNAFHSRVFKIINLCDGQLGEGFQGFSIHLMFQCLLVATNRARQIYTTYRKLPGEQWSEIKCHLSTDSRYG